MLKLFARAVVTKLTQRPLTMPRRSLRRIALLLHFPLLQMCLRAEIAAIVALLCLSPCCMADDDSKPWSFHAQATYIAQEKPSFHAAYTGPNSLIPQHEESYSFSTTLYGGARLWSGAEGYVNIEGVQGVPFSGMAGLGGFTNGELQKTAGPTLTWYRARLFVRQSFGFGGGSEKVDDAANQLGGTFDRRRLVITAGNVAIPDLFDTNRHAHDPRTDFANWALIDSGAYDYAADARGYTWGIAAEWHDLGWTLRAGRFAQPRQSNGLPLDPNIGTHYGDQVELELPTSALGRDGKVRLLAFRNVAIMGRYRDALALGAQLGQPPDIALVRRRNQKYGGAVNIEQSLASGIGAFGRASWNNGQTETYAFTEIDRSVAAGVASEGRFWGRPADEAGLAVVRNELSPAHRDYLAAGGLGFFLGDGRLRYQAEQVAELYYNVTPLKQLLLTFDAQRIRNPGYNADRGPANFYGVRVHFEF